MRYFLGPWQTDAQGSFVAPVSTKGLIDLRAADGSGVGFFACDAAPGSDYTDLGDTLDGPLGPAARNVWRDRVGMRALPGSTNVLEALWETLTAKADSDHALHARPIIPTHQGVSELHLGGHGLVRNATFQGRSDPAWAVVQRQMRENYRRIKGADPVLAAKYGECMRRKLRVEFVEIAEAGDQPQKPTTTYTESFNKVDSTVLGPDLTWTETIGDAEVFSNRARLVTSNNSRAEHDLSSDDHYTQAAMYSLAGTGLGVWARYKSPGTGIMDGYRVQRSSTFVEIEKFLGGAATSLGSQAASVPPDGTVFKIRVSGSSIKAYDAGSEVVSATDTDVTGWLRGGIGLFNSSSMLDAYESSDLVGTTAVLRRRRSSGGNYL